MKKENWFKLAIIAILLWQVILLGKLLEVSKDTYDYGVKIRSEQNSKPKPIKPNL